MKQPPARNAGAASRAPNSGLRLLRCGLVAICMALMAAAAPCAPAADTLTEGELRPWTEYRSIMWVGDSVYKSPGKWTLFQQRLKEMGINTGMVGGDADPGGWVDQKFPYYVENIVNRGLCLKWNSDVKDWDAFVTRWAKEGRKESELVRPYCLDDPAWRKTAREQMEAVARKNRDHNPVAYDIRDELSTTISANPFDYDFNPLALSGFRDWLRTQYPNLAALNAEWETRFELWDAVKPFTTDQIKNRMGSGQALPTGKPDWGEVQALRFDPGTARKNRTRWNFAPWADFRTYMDISLAGVLGELRDASRRIDPRTPVGVEGTQMPHPFGGYDLWRLSQALDWVEPYDIGNAREIFGSFMPGKTLVTTVFESDTRRASRRLWHLLLEGDRGCIIWWSEDCIDWKTENWELTPKARALTPVLTELNSPLGTLFLRARRERDPIFIHYSQPSIQVNWLMESTVDGSTWLRRFSSFEADHNRMAKVRNGWLKAFQDLGYSPVFVSSQQIESGFLRELDTAVLVLPESWALSDKEAQEIKTFCESGRGAAKSHIVLAAAIPGLFDEHGKLRERSPLESLFPNADSQPRACVALERGDAAVPGPGDMARYPAERLKPQGSPAWSEWLAAQIKPMRPEIAATANARLRIHRFRVGEARLLAVERNIDYQMSEELKQAGGNEGLETPVEVEIQLGKPVHVYNLRTQAHLGLVARIKTTVDPWRPSLFVLSEAELPAGAVVKALSRQ